RDSHRLGPELVLQQPALGLSNRDGHAGEIATGTARRKNQFFCPSVTLLLFLPHAHHHYDARHRSSPDELLFPRCRVLLLPFVTGLPRRSRVDSRWVRDLVRSV